MHLIYVMHSVKKESPKTDLNKEEKQLRSVSSSYYLLLRIYVYMSGA